MKYLLDTNICIYLIKKKPPEVHKRFQSLQVGDVGVSTITVSELQYGVAKSQNAERNQDALQEFLLPLEILPFEESAAFHYGKIRTLLERQGSSIGAMDLLIAAHALALAVPVVTNNEREFSRVPGLTVENWVER